MENALVWMIGISASVLAFAYLTILAVLLAAKRRMELPLSGNKPRAATRTMGRMPEMRYRTQ
jgi:hypothetical protein